MDYVLSEVKDNYRYFDSISGRCCVKVIPQYTQAYSSYFIQILHAVHYLFIIIGIYSTAVVYTNILTTNTFLKK